MHVTHALLTADGDVGVKCLDTMCYYIVFRFPGRCCSMTLHVDGSIASYRLKALLMPVAFPPVPVTTALYIVYCDRTCPRQQRMLAFCMGAVKSPKSLVHTLPENILEMVYAQLCDTPVPALVVDDNMWNVFYAWAASLMQ